MCGNPESMNGQSSAGRKCPVTTGCPRVCLVHFLLGLKSEDTGCSDMEPLAELPWALTCGAAASSPELVRWHLEEYHDQAYTSSSGDAPGNLGHRILNTSTVEA